MPSYKNDVGTSSTVFLRHITVFTFPPAFIMLLIHGILFHRAFPALGILPHAASVVFGSMLLYRESVAALGSPIQALSASNIFFADVTLAIWYMGFLIPTWVLLSEMWREDAIILGTYGTVFMMVNL